MFNVSPMRKRHISRMAPKAGYGLTTNTTICRLFGGSPPILVSDLSLAGGF